MGVTVGRPWLNVIISLHLEKPGPEILDGASKDLNHGLRSMTDTPSLEVRGERTILRAQRIHGIIGL